MSDLEPALEPTAASVEDAWRLRTLDHLPLDHLLIELRIPGSRSDQVADQYQKWCRQSLREVGSPEAVDRVQFRQFLEQRKWVPAAQAAMAFSLRVGELRRLYRATELLWGDVDDAYRASEGLWVSERRVRAMEDSYARFRGAGRANTRARLHANLSRELISAGVLSAPLVTVPCAVGERLNRPRHATAWCPLTGLPYNVEEHGMFFESYVGDQCSLWAWALLPEEAQGQCYVDSAKQALLNQLVPAAARVLPSPHGMCATR